MAEARHGVLSPPAVYSFVFSSLFSVVLHGLFYDEFD